MITVALITVLALALMPLVSGFTGGNDAQTGLNGVVDFLQRARVQASLTGRAHQVRVDTKTIPNGELRLDRGASSSCCCAGAPTDPFQTSNGAARDVDVYDLRAVAPGLVLSSADPQTLLGDQGICFTPDGRVLDPATLQPFASSRFDAGTLVLGLEKYDVEYGAVAGATGAPLPSQAWVVVLGYNGLARWEPKP